MEPLSFKKVAGKILKRKLVAFFLIMATANPVTWSYIPWIMEVGFNENLQVKLIIGILLLAGHISYARATLRSLGLIGVMLILLLCSLVIWNLVDDGVIDLTNPDTIAWSSIVILSSVWGFGMGWSIVRRWSSGQLDPTSPN